MTGIKKTGEKIYVEVSAAHISYLGDAASLAYLRDVTERKTMERQLAQSQKLEAIGQLAAGIAHEINTPTQYVGDNTKFLKEAFEDLKGLSDKYKDLMEALKQGGDTKNIVKAIEDTAQEIDTEYLGEEIPKAIEQTLEGVERVTHIVRAMKEFSHPGASEKSAVDINKAIENTITVARNEWKYVAEMVTDFDPTLQPVPCFPGEFNQVVLNLVTNAAHAIGEALGESSTGKGKITVSTLGNADFAEIRVSDTGPGIPPEIRSRIFDPFFTTKEVGKGTGQGLSIAHSVVVGKHGGNLQLETEMGKGSTFIICLPLENTQNQNGEPI
jgi:signal transduction histidine kinase